MIYLMRHGQTDWNACYKIQGRTDVPLNAAGRQMAREAREKYAALHFDICYASPLCRALETAEIFLEGRGVPIYTDARLKEMSFGICEGSEHVFEHPESPLYPLFKDPVHYRAVEGAESFDDLFARAGDFLDHVAIPAMQEGKDVLIVAHGAVNTAMICRTEGTELARFWDNLCGNCELRRLL
ncbi:MAG: histidine phosphatase family protein [Lachnospiraceae bacterium]|nr:histidine phosphatase family protein [Lachnospiraceae bacterium]